MANRRYYIFTGYSNEKVAAPAKDRKVVESKLGRPDGYVHINVPALAYGTPEELNAGLRREAIEKFEKRQSR